MCIASSADAKDLSQNVHLQEEILAGHSLLCSSPAIFTAYSHSVFPFEDNSWAPVVRKALRSDGRGDGELGTRELCHKCHH